MRLLARLMGAGLMAAALLSACDDGPSKPSSPIPADAPGFVKGKAVHPSIKIGKPYKVMGKRYYPEYEPDYNETGIASWYGPNFHGKMTANGETYNQWAMTAAHTTLPMPSMVRVTDLKTGKQIVVRINDRGPFADGRIIDLSRAAAEALGTRARGLAKVRVEYLPEETEAYIARLELKKPKAWRDVQVAQGKVDKALKQSSVVEAVKTEPVLAPLPEAPVAANEVPEHFAYEGGATTTTVNARGVVMEEIGYAEDAFSVLDNSAFSSAPITRKRVTPPMELSPSPAGQRVYVRAATYASKENAMALAKRLTPVNRAKLVPVNVRGETFWQVRLGPVFNRAVAEEVRRKLHAFDIQDAQIIEE